MKIRTLLIGFVVLLACGCTTIKNFISQASKENIEPPKALVEFTPSVTVSKLWQAKTGKGVKLSGARYALAFSDGHIFAASINGDIDAYDASTGKRLWRKNGKLRYSGGPSVAADLLVIGTLDGEVQAINARDGSDRWQVEVSSEVITAPAITDDLVIIRSHDGRVYALDRKDGSKRWVYGQSTVPVLSLRGNGAPQVQDGLVLYGNDNGRVVALRLSDGAPVWEQVLSTGEGRSEVERLTDIDGQIVVDSGVVYAAGYRGQVGGLLVSSGRPLWSRELSSYSGVGVSADHVYVSDADFDIWALDRRSGSSMWKQDALEHRWLSAAATQSNWIVLGDVEGYVHWLSQSDGKLAARQRLSKSPITATPLVVGDTVYVEDIEGEIGAYRVTNP